MKDALDCALVCEGGVEFVTNEDGDERIADLGRPVLAGAGEADVFLAKGLLRRCAVPLALKAMLRCQSFTSARTLVVVRESTQLHVGYMCL